MSRESLSDILIEAIPKAMRWVRGELRLSAAEELTIPQFRVLAHLSGGVTSNSELAELQGVDVTTMTRIVDTLERRELLERAPDSQDRRRTRILLTAAGKKLFMNITATASRNLAGRLEKLTVDQRQELRRGLEILLELVQKT